MWGHKKTRKSRLLSKSKIAEIENAEIEECLYLVVELRALAMRKNAVFPQLTGSVSICTPILNPMNLLWEENSRLMNYS